LRRGIPAIAGLWRGGNRPRDPNHGLATAGV